MKWLSMLVAVVILSAPLASADAVPSVATDSQARNGLFFSDPDVDLWLSGTYFYPGNYLRLSMAMDYDDYAYLLDVYIALVTPYGDVYFLGGDLNFYYSPVPFDSGYYTNNNNWSDAVDFYLPAMWSGWYTFYGVAVLYGDNVYYDPWIDYETASWYLY